MNLLDSLHQIVARLAIKHYDGSTVNGTGLYFYHEETDQFFIITNRHLLQLACCIDFFVSNSIDSTEITNIQVDKVSEKVYYHWDNNVDLCALNITANYRDEEEKKTNLNWTFVRRELILNKTQSLNLKNIENTYMVGFPDGLIDKLNNKPIIRAGISATKISTKFDGQKMFLIDIPCFPGSSGSPILIIDDNKQCEFSSGTPFAYLVGVACGGYTADDIRFAGHMIGIGAAVSFDAIQELVDNIPNKDEL